MTEEKTTTEKFEPTHIFAVGGYISLVRLKYNDNTHDPNYSVYLVDNVSQEKPKEYLPLGFGESVGRAYPTKFKNYLGRIYIKEMDMQTFPLRPANNHTPYRWRKKQHYFSEYDVAYRMLEPCVILPIGSIDLNLINALQELKERKNNE